MPIELGRAELGPQRRFAVEVEVDVIGDGADLRRRRRQMHERHARQMGVHDLVHLGVGADLEQVRELRLDFGQRPARRDFEHEGRVAEQRAVADRRDEGVLRALDDFEPDGAAAEPRAEEILDVAHQRREDVFEIVVVVGRIVARAPLRRREGREFAGDPQQLLVQPLGMDVARPRGSASAPGCGG